MPLRFLPARRVLMLIAIALAMLTVSMLTMGGTAQAAPKSAYSVPVLMYHYISAVPTTADANLRTLAVSPEHFKAQMQWLKDNGYNTISPDALYNGEPIPLKSVLVTFDDGYIDAYTNAFPILQALGFKGTFFIITDWVDQNKPGYVNWDEVKQMQAAGMTIGAHSRTHEIESGRTADWLRNEIIGSMDAIEKHTGTRPRFFAYPYGAYDTTAIKIAREAKLTAAFSTRNSYWNRASSPFTIGRLRIRGTSTVNEIASLVRRAG